jgi:HEAT repeat protein/beta-lactamase regulating signal transducer with metallopeptidase domain
MTWTYVIGWSLIHFLWQGALVAIACALLLALAGRRSPPLRYLVSVSALLVMALLPIVTALSLSPPQARGAANGATVTEDHSGLGGAAREGSGASTESFTLGDPRADQDPAIPANAPLTAFSTWLGPRLERAMPALVLVWLAGVLALSLRLLGGWAWAARLTTTGVRPAAEAYVTMARDLGARLRLTRPVRLLESTLVQVPAVVGWLRPTLLFPVSLASGLTPQQVEVLLAHELAHVRRYDYAVNLLQSVIETVLFYHPAVWWLSHRIRDEREHCCDDLAVAVTGSPRVYAGALLELEKLRAGDLGLAAAASGGSLVRRIRRLLSSPPAHGDAGQRWVAGALVMAGVLALGSGARLSRAAPAADEPDVASKEHESPAERQGRQSQGPPAPDTVIMVGGEGALDARWNAALEMAQRARFGRFWVGYAIDGRDTGEWLYFDRHSPLFAGEGTWISGSIRFRGSPSGISTDGVPLYPLFGARPTQDLAVLLSFAVTGGRAALDRVHLSSYVIPVHFAGQPVLWLGDVEDAESVPLIRGYLDRAGGRELREDLLSVIGAHSDSRVVVPVLTQWLQGGENDDLRANAAEWLGHHPDAAALAALARAARGDRSSRVRAEAAESVGDVDLPAAADTLIALARTLPDRSARLEAVEALGVREEERTFDALVELIRRDPSVEIQQEAVETLGDRRDDRAMQFLVETAESHPRRDVRIEALETVADAAPPAEALAFLGRLAEQDPSVDIQREAVETLGDIDDPAAQRLLLDLARRHPRYEARMEAVETLGQSEQPAEVFDALVDIARTDPHPDVQMEAVETLGELEDGRVSAALEAIIRDHPRVEAQIEAVETLGERQGHDPGSLDRVAAVARSHPRVEVRVEAVKTYAEYAEPEDAVRFLQPLARDADRLEVRIEALESLGELPDGAGVEAIIEIMRTTSDRDLRREAIDVLGDSEDPRAVRALEELIRRPR